VHCYNLKGNDANFNRFYLIEYNMALLLVGVNADEVHLCGEEAVIDLIKNIALDTGDTVEVKRSATPNISLVYQRIS